MIEGVHHHHQVMGQGKARIAQIAIGPELCLMSPTLRLHSRISLKRTEIGVRRGLPIVAWGMMQ